MSYNLYDWNNALRQRDEYVEDRLKDGSPIVAVSFAEGILFLTFKAGQRKIFEVYDRLAMGALGKQSDIESLRIAAIDTAHKEGFERSPDDVSIQRLVGFALSPAIKRVYNDQQTIPLTIRAVFGELGKTQETDHLFVLGYDGEFKAQSRAAVAAGTTYAEEQAQTSLEEATPQTLTEALQSAVTAWGVGRARLSPKSQSEQEDEEDDLLRRVDGALYDRDNTETGSKSSEPQTSDDPKVAIREALKSGLTVEAALLQRNTRREVKFRALTDRELDTVLADYQ